jgi:hypothetical protein
MSQDLAAAMVGSMMGPQEFAQKGPRPHFGSFHSAQAGYNLFLMINRADILVADTALRGASLRGLLILIRL